MKDKLRVALVGAGGYGAGYVKPILNHKEAELVAIIDPQAERSPAWRLMSNIPRYSDLTSLCMTRQPDVVIISSPIAYHEQQVLAALDCQTDVLCEKPLCATRSQAERIIEKMRQSGRQVAVGYQWSFHPAILKAKEDALSGRYGRLTEMRTAVYWPRSLAYYQRNHWAGRIADQAGLPVLDSVIHNATAHYLHNMLFFLGGQLDEAAFPEEIEARLWRAQPIENYDTAFVLMQKQRPDASPVKLMLAASHSTSTVKNPYFEFTFSHGRLVHENGILTGYQLSADHDGKAKQVDYGPTQGGEDVSDKLDAILEAARTGRTPVCNALTALPQVQVIDWLQSHCPIEQVPDYLLEKRQDDDTTWIAMPDLDQMMDQAVRDMALPGCLL